jgi:hypothetical protein
MSKFHPLRLSIGILILVISLFLLAGSVWPTNRMQQQITSSFEPSLGAAPDVGSAGLQETRLLTIEWPRAVRVGDSDLVRLRFEVDPVGRLTPAPESGGSSIQDEVIGIPDLYDTHNVVVEVRLDLAGMQVAPQATITEPIRRGQALVFYWSISPVQPGTYRGTLWVYLNMVPKGGGDIDRRALVAYRMEIEARSVLGLPASIARWGGAAGTLLGMILSMPFIQDILRRAAIRLGLSKKHLSQ